nr:reverse transcriptase domain-containing protein [Tanacetum cinerariifolium]
MSLLPSLRDPQSELLLLRSCMGVAKLLFSLRTCQPMYIGEAVSIFDNGLRRAIEAIVDYQLGTFGSSGDGYGLLPRGFKGSLQGKKWGKKAVKDKQEKDKIGTKPDKNGKRGKARQGQNSVTIKKAEKAKKIRI